MPISLTRLARFFREETGTVMAEAVLVLPFMLWSYLALFVYWDSFRSLNTVQKAAYTVSDAISREMVSITPTYINGLDKMLEYLVDKNQDVKLRVSSIYQSDAHNRIEIHWSVAANGAMVPLTTTTLQTLKTKIPKMADGDFVILVEVEADYTPAFNVGMNETTLSQFIVTRPRFVTCVLMSTAGTSCPLT